MPTGAGESRQLTHSQVSHLDARFFPDGRIFAVGNEPGHRERTYLLDMQGHEAPLTPEGVQAIAVSPDNKFLLTRNDDFTTVQLFPLDGSAPRSLPQFQKGDRPFDFTLDGTAVLTRRRNGRGASEVWRVVVNGDHRTLLRSISLSEPAAITNGVSAHMSRDQKNYAYIFARHLSAEYIVQGLH